MTGDGGSDAPVPQGPRAWRVSSADGIMAGVMVGMLLVVTVIFGLYLPKITGSWATLVVPLAAAVGLVFLVRRPGAQVAVEAGSLTLTQGRKRRQLRLAGARFGYSRWQSPAPGGLAGTILIVRDGETTLSIGGHRFLFDVPNRYQIKDAGHCDVYLESEAAFREFINHFEEQVRAHQPQSADLALLTRADQSPPEYAFRFGAFSLVVKSGQVALYKQSELASTTPVDQLQWSPGSDRVGSQNNSYLMPIVIVQLPDQAPLTVGTYSKNLWAIDAPPSGRPQYFVGIAEWLQLTRALGVARHLKAPRRR